MKINAGAVIGAILLACLSAPLSAHGLIGSDPAPDTTVSNLRTLSFRFSEPLDPKASGASLTMTGMPGMTDHPPMRMGAMKAGFADGGRTLILSAKMPLAAGSYRADWWATGRDGHKVNGQISFTVE
jgi:copper resistance protein C